MSKASLLSGSLGAAGLMFASLSWGAGPFDGLEMDVIAPGQKPKGPTSQIALPRAGSSRGALATGGASGYEDSIPDRLIRGEFVQSFGRGGDGGVGGNGGVGGSGGPGAAFAPPELPAAGLGADGGKPEPEPPREAPPPATARP